MKLPTIEHLTAFNYAVRTFDERFTEPDEVDRVARSLASVVGIDDPVAAASTLAYRIARSQGFAEGNKRTALLAARWTLDRNGIDGARLLPADDWAFADLLVTASMGIDVRQEMSGLLESRLSESERLTSRIQPERETGAGIGLG